MQKINIIRSNKNTTHKSKACTTENYTAYQADSQQYKQKQIKVKLATDFLTTVNLTTSASSLGIDYGQRYTGLALGYWPDNLVVPILTLSCNNISQLSNQIIDIVNKRSINYIILGVPVNKDGQINTINKNIFFLYHKLSIQTKHSVYCWDERYTSKWANRILQESQPHTQVNYQQRHRHNKLAKERTRQKHKMQINQLAAVNILQTFFNFLQYQKS